MTITLRPLFFIAVIAVNLLSQSRTLVHNACTETCDDESEIDVVQLLRLLRRHDCLENSIYTKTLVAD